MKNNYCIIMAGGVGSRFWPMSRSTYPKQFIDVLGIGRTLLQQTYHRFLTTCPKENIYVVTNDAYVSLVKEQLPQLAEKQILGEPQRRNTAPCIAYASYKIGKENPDANIVVAPSDHVIVDEREFDVCIGEALKFTASQNCLVTLGIKPSRPDTGYGYIQFMEAGSGDHALCKVKTFTEKPDLDMARFFVQSGEFLWNAGIFIWNYKSIVHAFKEFLPEMDALFAGGADSYNTPGEYEFIKKAYALCTNVSIDIGIMEKAQNVFVLPADFGWSDLGTWGSLYDHINKDADQNAVVGNNVMLYDSSNCVVNMPKNKLVVLQGLDDYIVVESDNILLVCKKQDEQQIRQFVNDVKLNKGDKFV
jgi:mannose-1-phosphate guanylyltransferase